MLCWKWMMMLLNRAGCIVRSSSTSLQTVSLCCHSANAKICMSHRLGTGGICVGRYGCGAWC